MITYCIFNLNCLSIYFSIREIIILSFINYYFYFKKCELSLYPTSKTEFTFKKIINIRSGLLNKLLFYIAKLGDLVDGKNGSFS